jgi:hypothetical protein
MTVSLDNWNGPHATLEEAVEAITVLAGKGKNAVLQRPEGFYINDGIDPDTGEGWATLPEGAYWLESD